jgi:hypothetical protein
LARQAELFAALLSDDVQVSGQLLGPEIDLDVILAQELSKEEEAEFASNSCLTNTRCLFVCCVRLFVCLVFVSLTRQLEWLAQKTAMEEADRRLAEELSLQRSAEVGSLSFVLSISYHILRRSQHSSTLPLSTLTWQQPWHSRMSTRIMITRTMSCSRGVCRFVLVLCDQMERGKHVQLPAAVWCYHAEFT